ncbi:MAG TPA: hypothetical protein VKA53_03245, partial [Thermoanaerobaculia bacterium]|nr:hypothetical protein [Thermoanaerobaculia bacterium]
FSFLYAHVPSFVNRSTQLPLYASRLTRAYLGASNPERKTGEPLYHVLPHDDVPLHEYWDGRRQQHGAPLHIINVTVNETVDGRSQVQQQDRKGCPLALGPCGLSLGVRHHLALDWPSDAPLVEESREERDPTRFRVFRQAAGTFKGETLSLGAWMGISGAAFSTGLGYRTSLGLSLLTGIANVRLGYWWYPGQKGRKHPWLMYLFPVQGYILSELIARFPGTAWKRWYLSDGGHFENLGGYELIRRRLPRIVLVDAECDPDYTFSGLANLVRKARVDFDTDIDFKDDKELERLWQEEAGGIPEAERPPLGALSALRREEASEESRACAALADVVYDDGSRGRLLYVKAALCGKVPVDVREYHAKHPEFPHETTADQFFDEAQWESYRKLGSLVSSRLFGAGDDTPPSRGQAWLRDYLFA